MKRQQQWLVVCVLLIAADITNSRKHREQSRKSLKNKLAFRENGNKVYVEDIIDDVCLPKGTDRLVYRYHNGTHIFIGFDVLKEGIINKMSWKLKEGNDEVLVDRGYSDYDIIPSVKLRKHLTLDHVLAAANKRLQHDFQKNMELCEMSITAKSCLIQVFAFCARKMKAVKFHKPCTRH